MNFRKRVAGCYHDCQETQRYRGSLRRNRWWKFVAAARKSILCSALCTHAWYLWRFSSKSCVDILPCCLHLIPMCNEEQWNMQHLLLACCLPCGDELDFPLLTHALLVCCVVTFTSFCSVPPPCLASCFLVHVLPRTDGRMY